MTEVCRNPATIEFMKSNFKPGAVIVSHGMRGGGKTHSAISFCQRMIEGYYPGMPQHIILATNVIFVKRTKSDMAEESPQGVHVIHEMRELFPIITDALERYGRKDTMVILLLDEAQNFLLGDMNSKGDMASAMKVFCGIIRKFNLCLWLISPVMRNLGPAFRHFLDADTDPGNVNCTMEKDTDEAKKYMNVKKLERDPRAFVFARQGFHARTEIMSVPTSSWTTDPEKLPVGGYAYDHLSSADFTVGDFPFHEFVRYISGKSSFGMVKAVREFYATLDKGEDAPASDGRMTEKEIVAVYYKRLVEAGVEKKILKPVFNGRDTKTLDKWAGIDTTRGKKSAPSDTLPDPET